MALMDQSFPIIFVLFFIVVIGLAIFGAYAAAKRRKALAAWAASRHLSFTTAKDYTFDNTYSAFKCLRQGNNQYAYNIATGSLHNHPVTCFDFHYETYSTDSKGNRQTHHHYFSAVLLIAPIPLQDLLIRPEHLLDKVTEFFGYDDIDFESAEFSRKFYVKAPDKRWAYDVIHARTMQFLLDSPRFTLQFNRDRVLAYRTSKFDPEEFDAAVTVITGILDNLPDYVIEQQRGTT